MKIIGKTKDEQTTTKPTVIHNKTEYNPTAKASVKRSPKKPLLTITLEEFLSLDAILRRHNHGKNALNRREILDKIFVLVIKE